MICTCINNGPHLIWLAQLIFTLWPTLPCFNFIYNRNYFAISANRAIP